MNLKMPFIETSHVKHQDEKLILVIDSNMGFVMELKELFDENHISILIATTAAKGLEYFHTANPDFVIIEANLPEMSGFELLHEINEIARSRFIPLAITSSNSSREYYSRAYELGAIDFIKKPIDVDIFVPYVYNRVAYKEAMIDKIFADRLTGAYNRQQFDVMIDALIMRHHSVTELFSIARIDFDLFNEYRELNGPQKSADVLIDFVKIAQKFLQSKMDVFRFSNDEFVLLFRHKTAHDVRSSIQDIAELMRIQWGITFCAGITEWDASTEDPESFLEQANYTLQQAKKSGTDNYLVYSEDLYHTPLVRRLMIHIIDDDDIVRAMLERQFSSWKSDSFDIHIVSYSQGYDFIESNWYTPHDFHVLLLDGVMPKMDGLEVLHNIKRLIHTERVLITMLTARKHDQDILHALNSGADDYMTKPFHPQEVLVRIQRLVNRLFL